MCHHVHVPLSAEDKAAARKITGAMVPVFAAVALAIAALLTLGAGAHKGDLVASVSQPAVRR